LSKRFDEEIPKGKTSCLSPAKAGRVFVFLGFRSLTRQISVGLDFLVLFEQAKKTYINRQRQKKKEMIITND